MTRGKSRRPGTRSKAKGRLPSDIADAAEAALDDMLQREDDLDDVDDVIEALEEEPRTQTRASSRDEREEDDDEVQTMAVATRDSKMPLPPPPRTTSVHTLPGPRSTPSPPAARPSTPPPPAARPSPPPPRSTPADARPVRATTPLTRTPPPGPRNPAPSVLTPTPAPRTPGSSMITPTPVIPRPRGGATVGETPQSRLEPTTAELGPPGIDETARVPADLLEIESGPIDADPDELVPLRPDLLSMQLAVYEEAAHLATLQNAIVAAGHVVHVGASARDGVTRVIDAIRGGSIDAVIVALPGGESIIEAALALEPRRPVVIAALSGSAIDAVARAHLAGADLVSTRPHDVERIAPLLLAASRLHVEKRIALAARGAEQVLRSRLDEIADAEPGGLLPFEMFQRVLELEIKRAKRYEYPLSVALFAVEIAPPPPPAGIRGILRARAGNAMIHTIRDIDIATQLDHERFLVLLPYTDLKGSAGLGRRVIAAVAALDPVVAAGRSFPPRVVGAVAGAVPGQPVSFAKLMKDATRALEQARRDGAELAVQP